MRFYDALRDRFPLRPILYWRYGRRFRSASAANAWYGAFASFAEARAAAPPDAQIGYDTTTAATLYDSLLGEVTAKDYPVLFWLDRILKPSSTLFDFGGHIGLLYYSYRRYLELDPAFRWVVCDVPAVVAAGAERARGEASLHFTTRFEDVSGADVLLASGSLQYVETPLSELLRGVTAKPRHVIVNKLPTNATREIITLQNIGISFCPYRIAHRTALPASLAELGYELVDTWENPETRTRLPYQPGANPITWVGYYLRRP